VIPHAPCVSARQLSDLGVRGHTLERHGLVLIARVGVVTEQDLATGGDQKEASDAGKCRGRPAVATLGRRGR
jgi:hypothetical protein